MLRISHSFDKELGPDGIDPLGDLILSDGRSEISIAVTYLDSWLADFIEVISRLSTSHHPVIEAEEPAPMVFDGSPDGHLAISFKDQTVVATGIKEFETALRAAVNAFLVTHFK